MDYVIAYCEGFDAPLKTSKHHFIKRLAADGHRVLILEVPKLFLTEFLTTRTNTTSGNCPPESDSATAHDKISTNIISRRYKVPLPYTKRLFGIFDFTFLNFINQMFVMEQLKQDLARQDISRPTLTAYFPLIVPIVKKIQFEAVYFHIVDEWQGLQNIPKSMLKLTDSMLDIADATIVTSQPLLNKYKKNSRKISLLRHGTDLCLFENGSPKTMRSRQPQSANVKVGYYGALQKVNFELVAKVASTLKEWDFIFVGPISGLDDKVSKEIKCHSNITIRDAIPRNELPKFLDELDLFWMPFQSNELTHYMCPIKYFEVMSYGLPIVCEDLAECRALMSETASLATGTKSHIEALLNELETNNGQKVKMRRKAVAASDWDNVYNEFKQLIGI